LVGSFVLRFKSWRYWYRKHKTTGNFGCWTRNNQYSQLVF